MLYSIVLLYGEFLSLPHRVPYCPTRKCEKDLVFAPRPKDFLSRTFQQITKETPCGQKLVRSLALSSKVINPPRPRGGGITYGLPCSGGTRSSRSEFQTRWRLLVTLSATPHPRGAAGTKGCAATTSSFR